MFDDFFGQGFETITNKKEWSFEKNDEGGTLIINAIGHNPKNIDIELINSELIIKSKKPENGSELVSDINHKFSIGSQYSEKDIKAEFENGLIKISFGIKEESKPKKIELKH
jgi:HSP20 family molecular chaperone IbpA